MTRIDHSTDVFYLLQLPETVSSCLQIDLANDLDAKMPGHRWMRIARRVEQEAREHAIGLFKDPSLWNDKLFRLGN